MSRGRYAGSTKKRDQAFNSLYETLTQGAKRGPVTLNVQGRAWTIADASAAKGVARVSFDELCRQPRGAIDYLELCRHFHTLFVEGIPRLSISSDPNAVRRLISLVDVCYEARAKVVCTAAASPERLVTDQADTVNKGDEAFAFDRAVSRLREMQSELYLQSHVQQGH